MTVDPRIQERRRAVQASRFRGSAKRLTYVLLVVAVLAGVAYVIQSPALAIATIRIDGAIEVPVEALVVEAGVEVGDPLLFADVVAAEEVIRTDPWVSDVAVRKVWPDTIEITVIERRPAAVLAHRSGDVLVSDDRVVLAYFESDDTYELILASEIPPAVGAEVTNPFDAAAVEFLALWDSGPATVSKLGDELWVDLGIYQVRLGGVEDIALKVRSLEAVLREGQTEGSLINVLAPSRPTVTPGGVASVDDDPPPEP